MFAAHGTIFVTELDALFDSCVSGRKSEAPASCRSVGQVVGRTELPRQLVLADNLVRVQSSSPREAHRLPF
jgi:hypothetical protein